MRIEYKFGIDDVEVPCFSVESSEGPGKLFTLATLLLNVFGERHRVDVIFHSPNQPDLPKKADQLKKVLESSPIAPKLRYEDGATGSLGSSYFSWVSIHASDAGGKG